MARLCERPDCSEPGAVAYGFDADRLLVWLASMQGGTDRHRAGVLCLRHADALVVPIGWSLDDAREPIPRLFTALPSAESVVADETGAGLETGSAAPATPPATASAKPRRGAATRSGRRSRKRPVSGGQLALDDDRALADDRAADDRPDTAQPAARTVAAVTGVSSAADDDPDATIAIPWMPNFDQHDDLGGVLAADSPLLDRAFRGTARQR